MAKKAVALTDAERAELEQRARDSREANPTPFFGPLRTPAEIAAAAEELKKEREAARRRALLRVW